MAALVNQGSKDDMLVVIASFGGKFLRKLPAGDVYNGIDPQTGAAVYLFLQSSGLGTFKVLRSATCAC